MEILTQLTGSHARSLLLDFFVMNDGREVQFNELQKESGINPRQLTLQLQRLKEMEFVIERQVGNKKIYKANKQVFYFESLKHFVKTFHEKEDWFRWERASTLHHIYMVAEAGMVPMREYFGICWPLILMIFTGENVLWCNRIVEMSEQGQKIIDWYRKPGYAAKYEKDITDATAQLEKILDRCKAMRFTDIDNKVLLAFYRELHDTYLQWYALLWTTELVSVRCEELLKQRLHNVSSSDISKLTALTRKSFSQEIEDAYGELVLLAKRKRSNFQDSELYASIKAFQAEYFWMYNNYFDTRVLQEEEIILNIKKRLLVKRDEASKKFLTQAEKEKLMVQLGVDGDTKDIIRICEQFTYWQDYRKKWIMIFAHYLEMVLAEIGRRVGMSLYDMRYTLPEEIETILMKDLRPDIKARRLNSLVVFEAGARKGTLYVGEKALHEERKYLGNLQDVMTEQPLIKGNVACSGKAIGVVKVLMNPDENYKVNHGDVLVTSMTSPDFMPAMRKAVAIITNEGGITCHAAVISRELNIPCIVGTKHATKVLKDGDKVEVDANKGIINILR